ncbi:HlyU family transcriptional regulator [Jannaschia pohangensis]|uniref:Transcriptional activator HlyU n=1 Tax=Jannaschia pohangensis TaxID=390807 RepID=A0A1I3LPQ7_9RHOB|nr:HlyU family transcriptional regulator [Jannaschia pohangensis]SFI86749.1 hypothetical protein SAMN04488095_1597 [Jannaschia pohangensis]
MDFLKKLFGGLGPAAAPPETPATETYNGFTISAAPMDAGGEFRIAATIEKDGKVHNLIRADTLRDRTAATEASMAKARQVIDEQGDRLFG